MMILDEYLCSSICCYVERVWGSFLELSSKFITNLSPLETPRVIKKKTQHIHVPFKTNLI